MILVALFSISSYAEHHSRAWILYSYFSRVICATYEFYKVWLLISLPLTSCFINWPEKDKHGWKQNSKSITNSLIMLIRTLTWGFGRSKTSLIYKEAIEQRQARLLQSSSKISDLSNSSLCLLYLLSLAQSSPHVIPVFITAVDREYYQLKLHAWEELKSNIIESLIGFGSTS